MAIPSPPCRRTRPTSKASSQDHALLQHWDISSFPFVHSPTGTLSKQRKPLAPAIPLCAKILRKETHTTKGNPSPHISSGSFDGCFPFQLGISDFVELEGITPLRKTFPIKPEAPWSLQFSQLWNAAAEERRWDENMIAKSENQVGIGSLSKSLLSVMVCQHVRLIRTAWILFTHNDLRYWRWFAWHLEVGQILIANLYETHREKGAASEIERLRHCLLVGVIGQSYSISWHYSLQTRWHCSASCCTHGKLVTACASLCMALELRLALRLVMGKTKEGTEIRWATVRYGEKMSLGMPWTLRYHGKQFVASLMGMVKGLGTELMLCWKWMEKSGLRISCCEPRCEAACEMQLWQAQPIGHHYQPFTQLIRERSQVIFTLIPKDVLGLLHTLPHSIAIYTPRSPRSYKHIHTQPLFVPALFL